MSIPYLFYRTFLVSRNHHIVSSNVTLSIVKDGKTLRSYSVVLKCTDSLVYLIFYSNKLSCLLLDTLYYISDFHRTKLAATLLFAMFFSSNSTICVVCGRDPDRSVAADRRSQLADPVMYCYCCAGAVSHIYGYTTNWLFSPAATDLGHITAAEAPSPGCRKLPVALLHPLYVEGRTSDAFLINKGFPVRNFFLEIRRL